MFDMLQVKQYEMLTAEQGAPAPDPEQADYRWDMEEIRDFHRAMEVHRSLPMKCLSRSWFEIKDASLGL